MSTEALTRAGLVAYIASWSGERLTRARPIANGIGIAYERERPGGRCQRLIRWVERKSRHPEATSGAARRL